MMISIGYYFDQVSRERMVQRISEQVKLIADSRPTDTPLGINEILWIETAHPNYHELDITWQLDGKEFPRQRNSPYLERECHEPREHRQAAYVHGDRDDPTPFVRDPAIRASALTATRTWTLGTATTPEPLVKVAFTGSTPTDRPVGGTDVVYVDDYPTGPTAAGGDVAPERYGDRHADDQPRRSGWPIRSCRPGRTR